LIDTRQALVVDGLSRYGSIVAEAIKGELESSATSDYLGPLLYEYPSRTGKGLRPSLCLATCEAFGGALDSALPSAVAIELLHNAFLVHDDIEDGSLLRRGKATLHRLHGIPLALNAGDALALHAFGALKDNISRLGSRLAQQIMTEFDFMSRQTVAGQALELGWSRDGRLDLTADDYLDLVMKKTCWYTTVLPLRIGALVGSRGEADLGPMISCGFHLGAAFQIRDDILNLTGDEAVYGKERFGDLREGRRTLVLIHLLAAADPPDFAWLRRYLLREPSQRRAPDVERVFDLMLAYGSVGFAGEFANGVARSAASDMDAAFAGLPDSAARQFLNGLVPFMVERKS
jgi:geranylgeranyl diphosphate synthase type II